MRLIYHVVYLRLTLLARTNISSNGFMECKWSIGFTPLVEWPLATLVCGGRRVIRKTSLSHLTNLSCSACSGNITSNQSNHYSCGITTSAHGDLAMD